MGEPLSRTRFLSGPHTFLSDWVIAVQSTLCGAHTTPCQTVHLWVRALPAKMAVMLPVRQLGPRILQPTSLDEVGDIGDRATSPRRVRECQVHNAESASRRGPGPFGDACLGASGRPV